MSIEVLLEIYQLLGGASSVYSALIILILILGYKKMEKLENKIDLAEINQESMNYAIEKVIANGKGDIYAAHRQEKKDELLKDREVLEQ